MPKHVMIYKDHKDFQQFIDVTNGKECKVTIEPIESAYSKKLRGSSHVWFAMCAKHLNSEGHGRNSKSKITGEPIELPWNETVFKAFYKDVLFEYSSKLSTEEQTGKETSDVANIIIRYWAERGVTLPPWPSIDNMSNQDLLNK